MKTIIAIKNSGENGKTETLRELANLLVHVYPDFKPNFPIPFNIFKKNDFRIVIEINGKIIGIESQGDPKTNLQARLETLVVEYRCDLIICTCRSKGETVHSINTVANNHNYQTIWNSTYQSITNHKELNKLKAKHLLDFIEKLKLI